MKRSRSRPASTSTIPPLDHDLVEGMVDTKVGAVQQRLTDRVVQAFAREEVEAARFAQTNEVFAPLTEDAIKGGYAIVSASAAGARFLAYASVVDDSSHDPTFISPMMMMLKEQQPLKITINGLKPLNF